MSFTPLTPHYNDRRATMLIIHGTECSDEKSRDIFAGKAAHEASCHYYIDDKGEVIQYVDETARAWHAGVGYWSGFTDINSMSIGIELLALSQSRRFDGLDTMYTEAQMKSLVELCKGIVTRNRILPHHVLAHQDVSCTREFEPTPENLYSVEEPVGRQKKYDPGPKFDWKLLADNGVGLWHGLQPVAQDKIVTDEAQLFSFYTGLAVYGYDIRPLPHITDYTSVIRAFQTHFLPWNISGQVTEQSIAALNILLAKKLS